MLSKKIHISKKGSETLRASEYLFPCHFNKTILLFVEKKMSEQKDEKEETVTCSLEKDEKTEKVETHKNNGEQGENKIGQWNCSLFQKTAELPWQNIGGPGYVRLLEEKGKKPRYRLVFRNNGIGRVFLNEYVHPNSVLLQEKDLLEAVDESDVKEIEKFMGYYSVPKTTMFAWCFNSFDKKEFELKWMDAREKNILYYTL